MRTFRIRNDVYRSYAVVMVGIDDEENKTVIVRLEGGHRENYDCRTPAAAKKLLEKTQAAWEASLQQP